MPQRATATSFKPGQTGNPKGRPTLKTLADMRALARKHTEAAVDTLVNMLGAQSERTKVAAAEALLDRGWGKPAQPLEHSGNLGFAEKLAKARGRLVGKG